MPVFINVHVGYFNCNRHAALSMIRMLAQLSFVIINIPKQNEDMPKIVTQLPIKC